MPAKDTVRIMDFEELYTAYFRKVYAFSYSLTRNSHMAEEITQETFFRVMNHPDSFRGNAAIETYLCRIARNLYLSSLRKRKKEYPDADVLETLPSEKSMEGDLLQRETAQRLHRLLHRLDEPYKEVFTLRTMGELPFQEIAALFEKSESWARVTYYRAKLKIQEEMQKEEP